MDEFIGRLKQCVNAGLSELFEGFDFDQSSDEDPEQISTDELFGKGMLLFNKLGCYPSDIKFVPELQISTGENNYPVYSLYFKDQPNRIKLSFSRITMERRNGNYMHWTDFKETRPRLYELLKYIHKNFDEWRDASYDHEVSISEDFGIISVNLPWNRYRDLGLEPPMRTYIITGEVDYTKGISDDDKELARDFIKRYEAQVKVYKDAKAKSDKAYSEYSDIVKITRDEFNKLSNWRYFNKQDKDLTTSPEWEKHFNDKWMKDPSTGSTVENPDPLGSIVTFIKEKYHLD